jgi:quinol monooxygenase YgiN
MQLLYNGFNITSLGDVSIKDSREFEGGEQTQRAKVRLDVTLDLFQRTYDENYAAVQSLRTAIALPNAVLQWTNDAAGVDYVNQTAVLVSDDLPDEWGEYHQTLHLVFEYYEQRPGGATNNLPLTFSKEGTGAPFVFDVVNRWQHSANTERFSTLRSQRRESHGKIHVEGQTFGDTTMDLGDRRNALAAQAAQLVEQMNSADGLLQYGADGSVFSGTVRIEEFSCNLNQLINALDWSFMCSYTLFPDELDYATAEFTIEETNNYTGELHLQIAGKIQAQDVDAAQAKLQAIITQVLNDNGYLAAQPLSLVTTPNQISANDDGDTFTEMTFSGAWRKWEATNMTASIQGASADPLALGNVNKWMDRVDTTRFNALRPHRERTTGVIEAAGVLVPDPSLAVVDKRAQLLLMAQALKNEVAGVDELTLTYGDWQQVVRVSSFAAQVNQAETGIEWSLTADYILFPNLASYATAQYTVAEQDNFTGEVHMTIAGRIQTQDEPSARAALSAILQQQLSDRNFTGGQILSFESTPQLIDADADGATFTELGFTVNYRKWKKSNMAATFGAKPAVSLGKVRMWRDRVNISRFNPLRPMRERAWDVIEAAGTWNGDMSLSLADRRAQLLSVQQAMKTAVNVPQDKLAYGDFSQVVRVTEFTAEINQAETGIDWSLSATYTLFPDESNYTITDFQVATRDNFTGETTLALTGKIQAATLALAQAKLTALAQTVPAQAQPGLGQVQQLTNDQTSNNLSTADGDTFIELNFSLSWRGWKSDNQVMTFKASNGGTLRAFGNVSHWRDHYSAQRFNDMRSQRRHATGSVEASGTIVADGTRAGMLALIAQLKQEVNNADGTLTYGVAQPGQGNTTPYFQQVVRVDDFQAQINQAETGIDWSLSASYSLFPNEGGYATTDFTVADRQDLETGDEFLAFAGKIEAPTQALAVAKLNSLRTAVLTSYGWTIGQQLRSESNAQSTYANGDATTYPAGSGATDAADGTTFIQLSFNEEYRRRIQGTLVGFTMRLAAREDIPTQTLLTSYAGSVNATGPTSDAAYAAALAKAQQLGANKETKIDSTAFLLRSEISFEQRQVTQNSPLEFVRISFSYEYQSKLGANRTYLEMTSTVTRDTFGADVETCAGFVAARDAATAQSVYLGQVRALYAGRLIHSEQTGVAQSQNQAQQQGAGLGAGQQWNPGGAQGAAGSTFNTQHLKFEFHLQVFTPKLAGEVGIKYAVEVTRDFLTLEMHTTVQGSCYAIDRPTADAAVTALLTALNFGTSVRSRRAEDREAQPGVGDTQPGQGNYVSLKLDFEEEFVGRVTGQAGVNEMKLSEKVVYSGTRWAVQNLPFNVDGSGGVSIPQPSGIEPGSRTVTGSVTAGTLATAQAWAMAQRALLTGDQNGGNFPQPEQWDTDYEFVPRVDGVAKGNGENVRLYRVNFIFAEILPLYPAPTVAEG